MNTWAARVALRLPPGNVAAAQAAGLAALAGGLALGQGPAAWAGAAAAAALFLVRVRGRLLTDWAGWRWRAGHPRLGTTVDVRATRHPGATVSGGAAHVGVHHSGGQYAAVLELTPTTVAASAFSATSYTGAAPLPLATLAAALHQYDITLAGLDIVVHGRKAAADPEAADTYRRLVEPLSAAATRRVWVVLRLDPQHARAAVDRRGGGHDGARRCLILAAQRTQRSLLTEDYTARLLNAHELVGARHLLLRGADFHTLRPRRNHVPLPGHTVAGYAVGARSLTSEQLLRLWAVEADATTLTVQLRPDGTRYKLTALAHHHGRGGQRVRPATAHRVSLAGRQLHALRACLPLGGPRQRRLTGAAGLRLATLGDLDRLHIPGAGCGQLLGADSEGRAVTARVASPEVRLVRVTGGLQFAQLVVLRALATGASVQVHTVRPHAWQPMLDAVSSDRLVWHESAAQLRGARLLVLDGAYAAPATAGTTVLQVQDPGSPATDLLPDPDIHLEQHPDQRGRLTAHLPGHRYDLALVSLPEELGYLAAGRRRATAAGPP